MVLVDVVVIVVFDVNLLLVFYGLVGSELLCVVECVGLCVVVEVFVDCGYCVDGSFVLCGKLGVYIDDVDKVVVCMFCMVCEGVVVVVIGEIVLL